MRGTGTYPLLWPLIALAVKAEAHHTCARCHHQSDRATHHVLTVHHLDGNKSNCRWWNLAPLCQRCHLQIQARVRIERPWVWTHTEWFWPYAAGYYAYKYLGQDLTRAEVMANLEELLALEAHAVLGHAPQPLGEKA